MTFYKKKNNNKRNYRKNFLSRCTGKIETKNQDVNNEKHIINVMQ